MGLQAMCFGPERKKKKIGNVKCRHSSLVVKFHILNVSHINQYLSAIFN